MVENSRGRDFMLFGQKVKIQGNKFFEVLLGDRGF
jgi:hypothetical protein